MLSATLTMVSTLLLGTDIENGVGGEGGTAGDGWLGGNGNEGDGGWWSTINTGLQEMDGVFVELVELVELVSFDTELSVGTVVFELVRDEAPLFSLFLSGAVSKLSCVSSESTVT